MEVGGAEVEEVLVGVGADVGEVSEVVRGDSGDERKYFSVYF